MARTPKALPSVAGSAKEKVTVVVVEAVVEAVVVELSLGVGGISSSVLSSSATTTEPAMPPRFAEPGEMEVMLPSHSHVKVALALAARGGLVDLLATVASTAEPWDTFTPPATKPLERGVEDPAAVVKVASQQSTSRDTVPRLELA